MSFAIDQCSRCAGLWFDQNEWETRKASNLHDEIKRILTAPWQSQVRKEEVRQHLEANPLSGHVFVFRNRRSDRVKLLYWDEDGYVIIYKRLEAGTFRFPEATAQQASVTLRAAELAMLLDGVDWQNVRRSRRYQRPALA